MSGAPAPEAGLYRRWYWGNLLPTRMDKFWSIFSMPIGVAFCFGPVLVAWWLAERKARHNGDADKHD